MAKEENGSRYPASNLITILIFIFSLLVSSGATYAAMSSRVAVLESKVISLEENESNHTNKFNQITGDISQIKIDIALIRQKIFEGH